MRDWWQRLWFFGRARRFDADLAEEMRSHLEMRAEALEADGRSADEARRIARVEFGSVRQLHEASRDVWVFGVLDRLRQDLRYTWRSLRRQPGFAAAVIVTLALGIGGTTAIFSMVDEVLLKPAPFDRPNRLMLVRAARPAQQQLRLPLSYANFLDLRTRAHTFTGLAAWTTGEMAAMASTSGDAEQVAYGLTTANLLEVLGVRPALGRPFRPDEDRQGTPKVAIISDGFWQRQYGGDRGVVGRTLLLDGEPHEIVAVLPPSFRFAVYPRPVDVWLPFGLDRFRDRVNARGANAMFAVGRLRDEATEAEAEHDVSIVAAALEREYPDFNRQKQMHVTPLSQQATPEVRTALAVLGAGVLLMLVAACANVANLLLARGTARAHEFTLRAQLGGSRGRLAQQLVVEHLALSMAGGAAGVGVAWLAHSVLAAMPYQQGDLFTPWMPSLSDATIDGRLLIFALALSLVVGVLVGLLPVLQLPGRRADTKGPLSTASHSRVTSGPSDVRARQMLVAIEVATAVILLAGTGLLLSSLSRLLHVSPGFETAGLTTMEVSLPPARYGSPPRLAAFVNDTLGRLRQQTTVHAAGLVDFLPFSGIIGDTAVLVEGQPVPPQERRSRVRYRVASDGYFETIGIRVAAGRSFVHQDRADAKPVTVINERAARELFPDGHAIGRRIALDLESFRYFADRAPEFDIQYGLREIVGVIADVRHGGLTDSAVAEMYIPVLQRATGRLAVVVRSDQSASEALAMTRAVIRDIDPALPVSNAISMAALVAASVAEPRFNATVLTSFGAVALVLAIVGIYGVLSYVVTLRQRDIGIHVAVGATPRAIVRLVVGGTARLMVVGVGIGVLGTLAAGPLLERVLYGVDARDPRVLLSVAAIVICSGLAATFFPVRRALRVDPAAVLKAE